MGKLTIKQEKFIHKYLECGNASEAYRFAYDCSRMSEDSVWNSAYKLLQNGEVRARIEYLKSHLAEAAGVSFLRVLNEHMKIAFSDATRVRNGWMTLKEFESLTPEERACIRSVETRQTKRTTPDGDEVLDEQVKITCYDKQKSLDAIRDMLGYRSVTRQEVKLSGTVDTSAPAPVVIHIDPADALSVEKTPAAHE